MPVAIVLPMERDRLFQERMTVTKQHIHFGRNQKILLIESVKDNNLNEKVSLRRVI